MRSGRFACRQCQKVSYTSQSGSTREWANARYHQLKAVIDAGKPKWQRWSTFNRVEARFERVNEQVNRSLMAFYSKATGGSVLTEKLIRFLHEKPHSTR